MLIQPLERETKEAILLAVLSIAAVATLRYPVESQALFLAEMFVLVALVVVDLVAVNLVAVDLVAKNPESVPAVKSAGRQWLTRSATIATPGIFAVVARLAGSPIAYEMTALTTFGAAALALSTGAGRLRSMSLVASGFLTLFAVAISDSPRAVWIAIAWMTVCVWHLVANHWQRMDLCRVENVRRGTGVRFLSVFSAVLICILSAWVVRDRFGESNRLSYGFMPTSGGTHWSDPAARSGVGTGDAVIAAKDHAESFGAVESDLFLESTESSLFDMFSDTIGEPKKKKARERSQAITAELSLESHEKSAKSEKGGSTFSTDRLPTKKHLHLKDAVGDAIVQWAGPTGIRLAMNRYDTFDGIDWTNEANHRQEKLVRQETSGDAWFCDPSMLGAFKQSATKQETEVGLLKVIRLDSARLPVPMMSFALHIKDVDRPDFFAIEDDDSFFMPGREKIPSLTVVDVASMKVMEDELWQNLSTITGPVSNTAVTNTAVSNPVEQKLEAYVTRWTADLQHPYAKLQAIVSNLRQNFTFDRNAVLDLTEDPTAQESLSNSTTPVTEFLRTRRGGDHLFATTAALMARQIGLQSRLVTGFYVRPSMIDVAAGHTDVLAGDVHVWAEVKLDDGRWFEIEPTPGYQAPIYTPSSWLVTKRFFAANWPYALSLCVTASLLFATRLFWIELGLSLLYPIGSFVMPRRRMSLAMRVLQTRAKYAGCPRIAGRPQRDWLLAITSNQEHLQATAGRFCDAADRAAFAGDSQSFYDPTESKELMMKLKIRSLRQLNKEAAL